MPTPDRRIVTHPGLNPLWKSLERERRQQQFTAIGLMILGLAGVIVGVVIRRPGWALLGSVAATASLWWLYRLLSEQPISFWREILRDEPETVVWVYGMVTERMPFGFRMAARGTLFLVEDDGEQTAFTMSPAHVRMVTKTLNRVLPNAVFGYTPEREMQFRGEVTNWRGRGSFLEWEERFNR